VKVRWLDADGRINGMSVSVGAPKSGLFWPAMDRAPDGNSFWVAWQASKEKEDGDDIFFRRLDAELKPQGSEFHASDFEKGKGNKASLPSVAVSPSNLFVAYAEERDRQRVIERLRMTLTPPDAQTPPPDPSAKPPPVADTAIVTDDKVGADFPAIACAKDACFVVWHEADKGTDKGAEAALLDPARATILWHKRFAPHGGHPALAINSDGQVEVAFYEQGRVRVSALSRDGVGTTSTFARVTGDEPRPWIAPGRVRGEWVVAWLDVEAGHTESFVARLQCRN
jgi:serine/threonine-protein kinase